MKVIDLKQRTPEWHLWRNAGVTASDAPILMGSPYKTPWRLWGEKRGLLLPEDLSGNPHVRRGIWDEPDARRRFEERHDVMLLPICAESDEEPLLRASFDGITDDGIPVELKAPTEENLREAKANGTQSDMYKRHYAQVQAQIFVSGSDKGFLSLKWRNDWLDWEVPRDDAFIGQIVDAARAFWECILTAKEPPLDMERDMYVPAGEELDAWLKLAADYRQLDEKLASYLAEAKPIEKKMDELEKRFLSMMGEFTLAESSGIRISRYLQRGSIDYKAALLKLQAGIQEGDLEPFRRNPSEKVRLTLREEGSKRIEVPFDPEALKQAAGQDYYF